MPDAVTVMEVCPRDGWQNLEQTLPLEEKLRHVEGMLAAGITSMQLTAFVHPKAVPQMADAAALAGAVLPRYPGRSFNALVPNLHGARAAAAAGFTQVSYVISVSPSHNRANVNRTPEESLEELGRILEALPQLSLTLSLATAFGCPFEGAVPLERVLALAERGVALGIRRLELADTVGAAVPGHVAAAFGALRQRHPHIPLSAHMHDTRGGGVLNSWVAMEHGADTLHGALGGLGGCPFAPGASGNTATEDLVYLLEGSGVSTGIDQQRLWASAREMRGRVAGNYSGHHIHIKQGEE